MPNISYDDYLGVTVTKPVVYQRVTLEEPISATFIGLGDWLILPNTFIASSMCDGTNTQITIQFNFNSPVLLKSEEQEKLRMIIADNFSGLLDFQVWATGTVEDRRDIT